MFQAGSDVVTRKGRAFRCLSGMAICVPVGMLGLVAVEVLELLLVVHLYL